MSKIAKALEKAKQGRELNEELPTFGNVKKIKHEVWAVKPDYSYTKVIQTEDKYLEKNRIFSFKHKTQEIEDAYDLLRTQVIQKTKEKGWNIIMVTSSMPGEGKTTTALNLAIRIAREENKTALYVETNTRNPSACKYLGIEASSGLTDYLLDSKPLQELLITPGINKLVILPSGKKISGAIDVLGAPKMKSLILELKNKYSDRYVIFDCPPLINMPEAYILMDSADAIIFIVEANKTKKGVIKSSIDYLKDKNVIGIVMNK